MAMIMSGGAVPSIDPTAASAVGGTSFNVPVQMSGPVSFNTRSEVKLDDSGRVYSIGEPSERKRYRKKVEFYDAKETLEPVPSRAVQEDVFHDAMEEQPDAGTRVARNADEHEDLQVTYTGLSDVCTERGSFTLNPGENARVTWSYDHQAYLNATISNPSVSTLGFVRIDSLEILSTGVHLDAVIDVNNFNDAENDYISSIVIHSSNYHTDLYTMSVFEHEHTFGVSIINPKSITYYFRRPVEGFQAVGDECIPITFSSTSFIDPTTALGAVLKSTGSPLTSSEFIDIITASTFASALSSSPVPSNNDTEQKATPVPSNSNTEQKPSPTNDDPPKEEGPGIGTYIAIGAAGGGVVVAGIFAFIGIRYVCRRFFSCFSQASYNHRTVEEGQGQPSAVLTGSNDSISQGVDGQYKSAATPTDEVEMKPLNTKQGADNSEPVSTVISSAGVKDRNTKQEADNSKPKPTVKVPELPISIGRDTDFNTPELGGVSSQEGY